MLKNESLKIKLLFLFTLGYVFIFSIYSVRQYNLEFIFYKSIMIILIFVTLKYYRRLNLSFPVLVGLSLTGLLHILGGNLVIQETILYHYWIVENYFKFDNLVHMFGSAVALFVAYGIIHPFLGKNHKSMSKFRLYSILVLITIAIGTIVEIIEFFAFLFFKTNVGDYMNNALDLVFNFIGALIGLAIFHFTKKGKYSKHY